MSHFHLIRTRSDPADKLVIIVAGKVSVEFEHSTIHRNNMVLKDGDYVGDMAILGDEDWANSTCFHFPPAGEGRGAPAPPATPGQA